MQPSSCSWWEEFLFYTDFNSSQINWGSRQIGKNVPTTWFHQFQKPIKTSLVCLFFVVGLGLGFGDTTWLVKEILKMGIGLLWNRVFLPTLRPSLMNVVQFSSYGFMQVLIILSGTTSTSVVQSTTAGSGGRRGQAIKSEAHTTTTGRPRSHKRQMMQHRIHENNNQVSWLKNFTTHCSLTNNFWRQHFQVVLNSYFPFPVKSNINGNWSKQFKSRQDFTWNWKGDFFLKCNWRKIIFYFICLTIKCVYDCTNNCLFLVL